MLRAALLAVALVLVAAAGPAQAAPAWLPPVPVALPATLIASDTDVAGDGAGGAAAVWAARGVQAAVRAPGGTWSEPQTLYGGAGWPTGARVAMSAAGEALAVWTEERPTGTVIRASLRPPGGRFGTAFDVSLGGTAEAPRNAAAPAVAMAPSGAAVVLWRRDAAVQAVARDAAGGQFGLPETLSAAGPVGDPKAVITAAGAATAVWREGDATVAVGTRPAGGEWGVARPWPGTEPTVTLDGAGAPAVSWNDQGALRYARGVAGGWSAPVDFGAGAWPSEIAVDGDGAVIALGGPGAIVRTPGGALQSFTLGISLNGGFEARRGLADGFRGGTLAFFSGYGLATAVRPSGGTFGPAVYLVRDRTVAGHFNVIGDDEGNATAVWQQFETSGWRIWSADYDAVAPVLSDVQIPARVTVGEEAPMRAAAADRLSGAAITWQFGDGGNATGPTVSHAFAEPGERTVTVTATDGVGNAVSRSAPVLVVPTPVAPARVVIDADGDGFEPPLDCDDTRAAIRPGTPEILGNTVDENCDGAREPYPTVAAAAILTTQRLPNRSTRLVGLTIRDLDAGDTVRVRCTGGGCRKALKHTRQVRKATKTLDLARLVKNTRLQRGAKLEVRITHARRITRIFTFVMRSGGDGSPRRVRECQSPDGGAKRAC